MALGLLHPLFWGALVLAGLILVWLFQRYHFGWVPGWFFRLVLVILTLIVIFRPESLVLDPPLSGMSILLLDQSDSLDPAAAMDARLSAETWQAADENRVVIPFGTSASLYNPSEPWVEVDGRASALLAALQKASRFFQTQEVATLIIATDGLVDDLPDVASALNDFREEGVDVKVLPLSHREARGDAALGHILTPTAIWEGTTLDVILPVVTDQAIDSESVIFLCNDVRLQPVGQSRHYLIYRLPRQNEGIMTLAASIDVPGDPFEGNNQSYASVWVFPPPRILFVSSDLWDAVRFTSTLRDYGLDILTASPQILGNSAEALAQYQLIFLHNLQAVDLTEAHMLALDDYVRAGEGGLIFLGGDRTYSLGGFETTPLASLLPVDLAPPARSERSPMLMLLVLDRSGSMGVVSAGGGIPIDLAKESAIRVIEAMDGADHLGVMTYSLDSIWHVPIRALGEGAERREAMDAVSEIRVDSLTNMYGAMEDLLVALDALPPDAPEERYLLLLSDGKSTDGDYASFLDIADQIAAENVVISTIAMGDEADVGLMEALAEVGNGRFYLVEDVSRLPDVMFAETQAAQGLKIQYGDITLDLTSSGHPILSGMSPTQLPSLTAYNALSGKADQGAETILVSSGFGDPLLASWQYGLGHVTAWMGDAGENWVQDWPVLEDEVRFWSQVIRYTLPNPALGAVQASVSSDAEELTVVVNVPSAPDTPGTHYSMTFSYAGVDGRVQSYQIPQISSDTFELRLPRLAEGAYRGVVTWQLQDREPYELAAPFAINPPVEWERPNPSVAAANIESWISLTSGARVDFETLLLADQVEEEVDSTSLSVRSWLILVLVVFWPLDIALRRRFRPWH